ncbi:MAG: hypothetical protein IKA22_05420 [Lentisphaeria bacterium]|nr:hypothetical protein [Lentisphaeria bacterium]
MKNTCKKLLVFCLLLAAIVPLDVWAKRAVPQPVKPIFWDAYKIEAIGTGSSGKVFVSVMIKSRIQPKTITIYEINYQKSLESDVQDLYITKLEIYKDLLIVKTEKGGIFSCDISSGKVKLIKLPQRYEQIPTTASVIKLKVKW